MYKIDQKDKKILHYLSVNARTTDSQIAKLVGLSRAAVTNRIKNLEHEKIIKKYITWINTIQLGYPNFHIYLKIKKFTKQKQEKILQHIQKDKNVKWLVTVGWPYDMFFVMSARDYADLDIKLKELYGKFEDDILNTKIHVVNEIIKDIPPYYLKMLSKPLKESYEITNKKIDTIDLEILRILSENARKNIIDISEKIKLTPEATSYRIKNLIKKGIIKKYSASLDYKKLGFYWFILVFKFNKTSHSYDETVKKIIKEQPPIIYADKTIDHRLRIQILSKTLEEINDLLGTLRGKFENHIEKYEILPLFSEKVLTTMPQGIYETIKKSFEKIN